MRERSGVAHDRAVMPMRFGFADTLSGQLHFRACGAGPDIVLLPWAPVSGRIAVLATEGTVKGGAYQRAILALRPGAHVTQVAAQIFVALAEEGWSEGEAVDAVTERYLAHLDARVDTVVLGCTHFPLLSGAIARQLGPTRRVVDSAATTARATAAELVARSLTAPGVRGGNVRLLATDSPERFARVGARFLGSSIAEKAVETIDL